MTTPPGPTGLDYHEAFKAMYPGLASSSVKLHEINDAALKVVDRAARLRRAERERVKAAIEPLLDRWEGGTSSDSPLQAAVDELRKTLEEIR